VSGKSKPADPVPATPRQVVVVATSAGGLAALSEVLARLPADFPAPILVVQHVAPEHISMMAAILQRRTRLKVEDGAEGVRLCAGTVYIAPPAHHLILHPDGTLGLSNSAPVGFLRPAADILFQSAADCYNDQVIAVVLSGTGHDGAAGVRAVKRAGGSVIVQDPSTAEFSGMPVAAIATGDVDFVRHLGAMAQALENLIRKDGSE
jgi:two-component system chemotaxis response regulator CheB